MKIVMLDRNSIGMDISTDGFKKFGDWQEYDTMSQEDSRPLIQDADVIIFNKTRMNQELLKDAKKVRLLCVTATGYDNVDLVYARSRKIAVCNVRNYSTPAVVQHTFSLALYLLEKISFYNEYVRSGAYSAQMGFSNFSEHYWELSGKTWGIIGMGNIGRGVARVAQAFGCHVMFTSMSGRAHNEAYEQVDFETLLEKSDIISLHCPLTKETENLMNLQAFSKMKKSAILINVARGAVVNDADLYMALSQDMIAAAGLDVLTKEPMDPKNPLAQIKDGRKLIITPHMAWASVEARTRCMQEIEKNIDAFLQGEQRNRVDLQD